MTSVHTLNHWLALCRQAQQADGPVRLSALAQLEALVAQMENGELPLEASLAAYERGVELSKICQKLLDKADEQVKVLQGNLLKPLDDRGPDEE